MMSERERERLVHASGRCGRIVIVVGVASCWCVVIGNGAGGRGGRGSSSTYWNWNRKRMVQDLEFLICACYSEGIRFSPLCAACFGLPLLSRRPREPYNPTPGCLAPSSLSLSLSLPAASPCSPLWENKATMHMHSCTPPRLISRRHAYPGPLELHCHGVYTDDRVRNERSRDTHARTHTPALHCIATAYM